MNYLYKYGTELKSLPPSKGPLYKTTAYYALKINNYEIRIHKGIDPGRDWTKNCWYVRIFKDKVRLNHFEFYVKDYTYRNILTDEFKRALRS